MAGAEGCLRAQETLAANIEAEQKKIDLNIRRTDALLGELRKVLNRRVEQEREYLNLLEELRETIGEIEWDVSNLSARRRNLAEEALVKGGQYASSVRQINDYKEELNRSFNQLGAVTTALAAREALCDGMDSLRNACINNHLNFFVL